MKRIIIILTVVTFNLFAAQNGKDLLAQVGKTSIKLPRIESAAAASPPSQLPLETAFDERSSEAVCSYPTPGQYSPSAIVASRLRNKMQGPTSARGVRSDSPYQILIGKGKEPSISVSDLMRRKRELSQKIGNATLFQLKAEIINEQEKIAKINSSSTEKIEAVKKEMQRAKGMYRRQKMAYQKKREDGVEAIRLLNKECDDSKKKHQSNIEALTERIKAKGSGTEKSITTLALLESLSDSGERSPESFRSSYAESL